jgi:hypothetical protein
MRSRCQNKCFKESLKRSTYRIPNMRSCTECEYFAITDQSKCYCCKTKFRTRPNGHSRNVSFVKGIPNDHGTIEIILANSGKKRI